MSRIIKYNGNTIKEMTVSELENQYKKNKTRLLYRTIFFIIIALAVMFYELILFMLPIGLDIITGYWLVENNNTIKNEIEFKECENCHQYFIPVNRKDEIYCNRPIKGTEKTCKDVGAMNRHKEKAGDIPGEKEYWRVYKRYKYKADRKIISKSEFNQWNYMALELKQECAERKITVNDMLQRIEVFENRKKVGKK